VRGYSTRHVPRKETKFYKVRDSEFTCECRRSRDPARHRSQGERWRGPCHNEPNGSGKSTLAQVLAGREDYHITAGEVLYEGNDLLQMPPEARARDLCAVRRENRQEQAGLDPAAAPGRDLPVCRAGIPHDPR